MSSSSEAPDSVRASASLFASVLRETELADPAGMDIDGVPVFAVLRPETAAEVAACLGVASRHGIALVPRGGGTKLGWGNVPRAKSLAVLDVSRLCKPLDLLPEEGIATAAAGVRVADFARQAAAIGRRSLLDGLDPQATIGGTVASDPLGCEFTLDRRLRMDLLGLQVALANGTLTRCGGRVVKNVTGFDLVRLYCGALGTLGVITEVTLRLHPLPELCEVYGRELGTVADAISEAQQLLAARIPHAGVAVDPSGRLLWRLEGGREAVALYQRRFAGEALDLAAWEQVRARRVEPAPPQLARLRISARPSDVGVIAHFVQSWAGEGALRLALPAAGTVFACAEPASLAVLFEQAARQQWLVFVEAAPLSFKESGDVFGPATETLPIARAIKRRFDPEAILSPGRFQGRI
jgi:glycolate oxidase FAD binding subunit